MGASMRPPLAVVILAAGQGTRMKSGLAKVLHEIGGRPMLAYPLAVARGARSRAPGRRDRARRRAGRGRLRGPRRASWCRPSSAAPATRCCRPRRARRLRRRRADPLRRHAAAARRDPRAHAREQGGDAAPTS